MDELLRKVDAALRQALLWWREVLSLQLCELRPWQCVQTKPCRLFVDAAGMPARCAAVRYPDMPIQLADTTSSSSQHGLQDQQLRHSLLSQNGYGGMKWLQGHYNVPKFMRQ